MASDRTRTNNADAKKLVKDRRRFGPYSKRLHRGAIGNSTDGRSERGRFIRHLEAELISYVGGEPTIAQRLLIDRTIKIRLQLDLLDDKLVSDNWTAHDQRTYGALLNAQRLCLRELTGLKAQPLKRSSVIAALAEAVAKESAAA